MMSFAVVVFLTFNFQHHTASSSLSLSHITYSRDGENFLLYQRNSCWVIISFILMTFLSDRALILQRET